MEVNDNSLNELVKAARSVVLSASLPHDGGDPVSVGKAPVMRLLWALKPFSPFSPFSDLKTEWP